MDFDIDEFYGDEIQKKKIYEKQKDSILEKVVNNKYSEEQINEFDKYLSKLNNFRRIRIDSIYRDEINRDYTIMGITYDMMSWSNEDTIPVARFENINFDAINMMKSPNGKFMALYALNAFNRNSKTKKNRI